MPLVRISVRDAMPITKRRLVADAVYDAMRATIGIPEGDRFIILSAHSQDELFVDPNFKDMKRTADFALIHITLRRGRTVEAKQALFAEIASLLAERAAIAPDNTMIVLAENDAADWSFGRGEAQLVLQQPPATPSSH